VDDYPVSSIQKYERELLAFMQTKHSDFMNDLQQKKAIDSDIEARLQKALEEFKAQFVA
jgi:F-type H+-transporting ATPase subunit alpha